MTINTERLNKLADIIEEREDHFCMGTWFRPVPGDKDLERRYLAMAPDEEIAYVAQEFELTECGTTACAAGWAVYLWPFDVPQSCESWVKAGATILGLGHETARSLFVDINEDAKGIATKLRRLARGEDVYGTFALDRISY